MLSELHIASDYGGNKTSNNQNNDFKEMSWKFLPHCIGIPEYMQSFESAPPLITLSPLHQSAHITLKHNIGHNVNGSLDVYR